MTPQPTTAELEIMYQKDISKLALRAQKLEISKHQDRVIEKISEAGDVDAKILEVKVDMDALAVEHLTLKEGYDKGNSDWKAKLAQVK